MPLYRINRVAQRTHVYLWKITETERELAHGIALNEHSTERVKGMRSELHRRGYLSIRHLLAEAGYTDFDLYYDADGKPHLRDGNWISITHSGIFTGIIVSKAYEVGIDIERQREKILTIAHKFTTLTAGPETSNTEVKIRKLTRVWGAKESLYKIHATKGLSFLDHIDITDFPIDREETSGEIHYEDKTTHYTIRFFDVEEYTCVYALKT